MPRFRFAVKDEWGRRKTGGMDAPDLEGARQRLLQGGFVVISLVDEGQPLPEEAEAPPRQPPSKRVVYVALVLLALGLLVGLAAWLRRPVGKVPPPQPLKLVFQGQANGACQRVVLDLPELPLHEETVIQSGRYKIEVNLKVSRLPTYAWLQAVGARAARPAPLNADADEQAWRKMVPLKKGLSDYSVDGLKL